MNNIVCVLTQYKLAAFLVMMISIIHLAGCVFAAEEDYSLGGYVSPQIIRIRKDAIEDITDLRTEIEDKLRIRVIGSFRDPEQIEKLRIILNKPWDTEGINYLCEIAKNGTTLNKKNNAPPATTARVLNLLAYVHTNYKDKELQDPISEMYDSIFSRLSEAPRELLGYYHRNVYSSMINSIIDYGSSKLLGPGFWECMKTGGCLSGLRVFRRIGDKSTIQKLRELKEIPYWVEKKYDLENTIEDIEARLRGDPPRTIEWIAKERFEEKLRKRNTEKR